MKLGLSMDSGKVLGGLLIKVAGFNLSVNTLMIILIVESKNMKKAMSTMEIIKTERHMEEVIFITIIYTIIGILRYTDGSSHDGEWRDGVPHGNIVYTL